MNPLPARRAICALLTSIVAAGLLTLGTTAASPADKDETRGTLLLVLDSSGSMKEKDRSGSTKITAARKALKQAVQTLPDEADVGMRVYGATVFDKKDQGACRDSQLVVPPGPLDESALNREIDKYKPYGETPIAYSLRQAARDLGKKDGQRTILLVSDGEETCAENPCDVAKNFRGSGIDLKIDVVGVSVPDKARRQLQCIAKAGGGDYCETQDGTQLTSCLTRSSMRAFRPFAVSGTPVKGGLEAGSAPELKFGQHTDILGGDEEATGTKYYRVAKPDGATVHAAVTARTDDPEQSDAVDLSLQTPGGDECSSGSRTTLSDYEGNPVINASVIFGPRESDTYDCASEKSLMLVVRRGNETQDRAPDTGNLPIEILTTLEPRVLNLDELPEQVDDSEVSKELAESGSGEKKTVGGSSFSDAPTLAAGTYTDTVQSGEALFYRVPAEWGQTPRFSIRLEPDPGLKGKVKVPGAPATLSAFAPDRTPIAIDHLDPGYSGTYLGNDAVSLGANLPEIRYRNREHFSFSTRPVGPSSLAGDYVFSIYLREVADNPRFQVRTRISVDVAGSRSGVPEYAEDSAARSTVRKSADTASTGDAGGRVMQLVAIAAGALIVLGVMVPLWIRRRRQREL
jgi:Ca-activated chloride channel family protein